MMKGRCAWTASDDAVVDAEAAALAAPRRAIGQANFVDGVADSGYSLSGALIVPETLDYRAQIEMNRGKPAAQPPSSIAKPGVSVNPRRH